MTDKQSSITLQENLVVAFNEVVLVVKAMENPNRFKILLALLVESLTFQALSEKIDIGRTALANHLAILRKALLIEKIHHGSYDITPDGRNYLQAINTAYQQSTLYLQKQKDFLEQKQSIETFLQRSRSED